MATLHRWACDGRARTRGGPTCSPTITMRGRAVLGNLRPDSEAAQCLKLRFARRKFGGSRSCRTARRGLVGPAFRSAPQLLTRQPCALNQRLEFRPHDLRVHAREIRHLREAAVRARDQVLAPD